MRDNYTDSRYLDDNLQAKAKERGKCTVNEPLRKEADSRRAVVRSPVRVRDLAVSKIVAALELTMLVLTARDHDMVARKPD